LFPYTTLFRSRDIFIHKLLFGRYIYGSGWTSEVDCGSSFRCHVPELRVYYGARSADLGELIIWHFVRCHTAQAAFSAVKIAIVGRSRCRTTYCPRWNRSRRPDAGVGPAVPRHQCNYGEDCRLCPKCTFVLLLYHWPDCRI